MDPNETLREIRELVGSTNTSELLRLAQLVDAMDDWIVSGGFLPSAWGAAR